MLKYILILKKLCFFNVIYIYIMMETKEQQLYRINRINRQKLIDELNMKKKNLIVKYKPVKEIDELPKSQREFINYKKNFNKKLLKNKKIISPEFIDISTFKPEERKLLVGDDDKIIGSLLISKDIQYDSYKKIDELFQKNLTSDNLMDYNNYAYVNQQIGDDYVYKNMINKNFPGIKEQIKKKYSQITVTEFIKAIRDYFKNKPLEQQEQQQQSQYIPINEYTESQKLYYDAIKEVIKKLKNYKVGLSKYKKIESNNVNERLKTLIDEYNKQIDDSIKLIESINEYLEAYNKDFKDIPNIININVGNDEINSLIEDINNRLESVEESYNDYINFFNDITIEITEVEDEEKMKNEKIKEGVEKLNKTMKNNISEKYKYAIKKLKENRDNIILDKKIKNENKILTDEQLIEAIRKKEEEKKREEEEFFNNFDNIATDNEKERKNEKIKKGVEKGVEKIEKFKKDMINKKYKYVIKKLKENRDKTKLIDEEEKNIIDNTMSYLEKTMTNSQLPDEIKEDILNEEINSINDIITEPIQIESKYAKENIEKLISSIEKIEKKQKNYLKSIFIKALNDYIKKNKEIVMNEINKEIVNRAIQEVEKIENNNTLTMEEKQVQINVVFDKTKEALVDTYIKLKTNLLYINKLLDYAIGKKPDNAELKKIKEDLNKSKTYNDLIKNIRELYKKNVPSGTLVKYDVRLKEILTTFGFDPEELKNIEKDTTQNQQLFNNMLKKVDNYSKLIKDFITKTDTPIIENEIDLLKKTDKIITNFSIDNIDKLDITAYRKVIVDLYNDLKMRKKNGTYYDSDNNALNGLQIVDLPDLTKNNIMFMISKIYDVYLGNISEVMIELIKQKKLSANNLTVQNVNKLFEEKKKILIDDTSTEATDTQNTDLTMAEKKKKILN